MSQRSKRVLTDGEKSKLFSMRFEGKNYAEIAHQMGLTEAMVGYFFRKYAGKKRKTKRTRRATTRRETPLKTTAVVSRQETGKNLKMVVVVGDQTEVSRTIRELFA
jgi:predicted transcriptional regulator